MFDDFFPSFWASTSHVLLVESALLLLQHASTPNSLLTRNRSISCAAWPLLHSTPWLPAVLLDLGLRATWRSHLGALRQQGIVVIPSGWNGVFNRVPHFYKFFRHQNWSWKTHVGESYNSQGVAKTMYGRFLFILSWTGLKKSWSLWRFASASPVARSGALSSKTLWGQLAGPEHYARQNVR